jgi:hypothetical protein
MKRLGPELKMPDMKVPPALADLYYDLLDRRLLPLVALVVVAIAAVPFLLGGGSDETPPAAQDALAEASALEAVEAAKLTVVEAKPGLRDYRKRLKGRTPTDPFKQRYTQIDLGPAKLNPQTESSTDSATTTTTTTTTSGSGDSGESTEAGDGGSKPPSTETPGTSPSGKGDGKPDLTFYTFAIKVRIAKAGGNSADSDKKQEPVVRERVLPLTELPGEKAPVVTYMGSSKKGKALLMVSNDVKSTFGDAKCISGDDVCQLLEAEPGFPVTFVYGAGETRYTIQVLKIYPVVTGRS